MIANKVPHRTCSKCFRHLPNTEFRFLNRSKNIRACECKSCRNRRLRRTRAAASISELRETCTNIRRSESAELILQFIDSIIQRLGGTNRVMALWAKLIRDSDTPAATRAKSIETLTFAAAVASREIVRTQTFAEVDPLEFVQYLHSCSQLVPLIRALLADGVITLDDIDPPPGPWLDESL